MILFVTGQYAGAQYLYPLIKRWKNSSENNPEYKIVATGASIKYWKYHQIGFDSIDGKINKSVEHYLNIVKPKLILLSASSTEELEYIFILQAKKIGIKTANFIDIWTNYKSRYIYRGKEVYPDMILSINDKCTEEMVNAGIPAKLIKEIGQPYLEEVSQSIPPLGSKILLPLQSIKKAKGCSLGYNEDSFLELSLEAINIVGKSEQLYITVHPDIDLDMFKYKSVKVDLGRGIEDIKNSHTVLGMFSMQMIIGYLWGRRVASIQPGLKVSDPSALSRWGLVPLIEDKVQLSDFLKSPVNNVERKEMIDMLIGSLDRLDEFCQKESIA